MYSEVCPGPKHLLKPLLCGISASLLRRSYASLQPCMETHFTFHTNSIIFAISSSIIGSLFTVDLFFMGRVSSVASLSDAGNLQGPSPLILIARREPYTVHHIRRLSCCDLQLDWTCTDLRAGNRSRRVSMRSKYPQQYVLNALAVG